jgi:hypothetical protein
MSLPTMKNLYKFPVEISHACKGLYSFDHDWPFPIFYGLQLLIMTRYAARGLSFPRKAHFSPFWQKVSLVKKCHL